MEIPIIIVLTAASFVLLSIYIILYWKSYVPIPLNTDNAQHFGFKKDNTRLPSFSVVIITHDCDSLLEQLIKKLVAQQYPFFEILIVNNASTDGTNDVIKRATIEHPDIVRHTYLPQNRNGILHMSIATTLGVRAARNEWIILLKPTSFPKSELWIASIAHAILEGANICLGYNDYFGYDNSRWVRKAIRKRNKAQLLNFRAIFRGKCKPVECEGSNIVFSKKDFLKNGGYRHWLYLKTGHENLYITTNAPKGKTAFLTEPDSQVETILPPIEDLWKIERKLAVKSYKKFNMSTKLRRNHYTILGTVYVMSVLCMLASIYFTFFPLETDSSYSILKTAWLSADHEVFITIPCILLLLFVIISLIHYFFVINFYHRDRKRLYTPLRTDSSEIMTK